MCVNKTEAMAEGLLVKFKLTFRPDSTVIVCGGMNEQGTAGFGQAMAAGRSPHVRRLAACVLCAPFVLAQAGAAQDPTVASRRAPAVSRDMRYREWVLKELERRGKKRQSPEQERRAWERIREDFRSLQVENNALRDSAAAARFDNARAQKAAAEIGRRAARLGSELALPEVGEEVRGERAETLPAELQLGTLISALDGVVRRFVKNPVFDEAAVLDVQSAIRARLDLERIVELSHELRRRLRKAEGNE